MASEQDAQKRAAFREAVAQLACADLVFLDEAGFNLAMTSGYGWGKKGEALMVPEPFRRGGNLSVLGALDREGIVAFTWKEGAMRREDVERFFEEDLLPQLLPGSVLVLDNASIHKGGRIESLAEGAGCRVLYLPPYSPDSNPIEMVWSWVKRLVRREGPREDESRRRCVSESLPSVTSELACACFRHCTDSLYQQG